MHLEISKAVLSSTPFILILVTNYIKEQIAIFPWACFFLLGTNLLNQEMVFV